MFMEPAFVTTVSEEWRGQVRDAMDQRWVTKGLPALPQDLSTQQSPLRLHEELLEGRTSLRALVRTHGTAVPDSTSCTSFRESWPHRA
jgi:hypothetical protein